MLSTYDVIVADPPHGLSIEFMETLTSTLSSDVAGILILYFSHKEAEWISLFVQLQFDRHRWARILNILIGDERVIIAIGDRLQLDDDEIAAVVEEIKQIGHVYGLGTTSLPLCIVDADGRQL